MEYAALLEREAVASRKVKDAQKALNTKVLAQYAKLTEAEIRKLVVDDKWLVRSMPTCRANWIGSASADRARPGTGGTVRDAVAATRQPVEELEARVNAHLQRMGFAL